MTLLALKYRPHTFNDLYGQMPARAILQSYVHSGDCPPAFLFTGPSGTGKTSAARILAAALNCENPNNGDCCNKCSSCVAIREGQSPDIHEIDAASNGGVDSIREIKNLSQYGSSGNYRVIILDEAHSMSTQAFNALLKVLEEPSSRTIFVLLTTEPNKIIPTVRTRSMPVEFQLLPPFVIFERLKFVVAAEGMKTSEIDLKELSKQADGSLRNGLMLLDQAKRSKVRYRSNLPSTVVTNLIDQDLQAAQTSFNEYFDTNNDAAEFVAGMIDSIQANFNGGNVTPNQLVQSMKLLWDARLISSSSRSARSQLSALLILLYSLFIKTTYQPQKSILPIAEQSPTPAQEEISSMEELISLTEG